MTRHALPEATPIALRWRIDGPIAAALCAVALLLRAPGINRLSLWGDEIAQVVTYYGDGLRQVMYGAARHCQPPLDYWLGYLLFQWQQGDGVARLPAMLFGVFGVGGFYLLCVRTIGRQAAVITAILLASSPVAIRYSQEARPYAIFWCTLIFSLLLLGLAWQHNRPRHWLCFALAWCSCQMSRSLAPMSISVGLGWCGLVEVWRSRRRSRGLPRPRESGSLSPGAWLCLCLAAVWLPFGYLFTYILQRASKQAYVSNDTSGLDPAHVLDIVGSAGEALLFITQPYGVVLVPIGCCGLLWSLVRRREPPHAPLVQPLLIGFSLHTLVYALGVRGVEPKMVYWGYMLPVLYLGVGIVVQILLQQIAAWRRLVPLTTGLLAGLAALQAGYPTDAITGRKADWRGVCRLIGEGLDPQRDVVFCSEAALFGTAGMVFRVSPHYWPTADHLINIFRDAEQMNNNHQPVLNRRDCRVALMVRCSPNLSSKQLHDRMRARDLQTSELHTFHQFFALISRASHPTADHGLQHLLVTAQHLLGEHAALGVYLHLGAMRLRAKQDSSGDLDRRCRSAEPLVLPRYREEFAAECAAIADIEAPLQSADRTGRSAQAPWPVEQRSRMLPDPMPGDIQP